MVDLPHHNGLRQELKPQCNFACVVLVSQNDGKDICTRGTRFSFSNSKSGSAGAAEPTGSPPVLLHSRVAMSDYRYV